MKKEKKAPKKSSNPKGKDSSKKSTPSRSRAGDSKKSGTRTPKSKSPASSRSKSPSVASRAKAPSAKARKPKAKASKESSLVLTANQRSFSTINPPIEPSVINGGEIDGASVHSAQNASRLLLNPNTCSIHSQPFVLYCETCEEPVCEECHRSGPHADVRHKLIDLQEAFVTRLEFLAGHAEQLAAKREVVLAQAGKVEYRVGEINSIGGIIEKDIKTEYAGMLERHKFKEGESLAVLQHDMGTLERDVERVDSILNAIDEHSQGDQQSDCVGFLSRCHELLEYADYALAKPFKTCVDASVSDLSNEYALLVASLENSQKLNNLMQLKDNLILDLMVKNGMESEFGVWEQLRERYEKQVNNYQMVCAYCGAQLSSVTVNEKCLKNEAEKLFKRRFTVEEPPIELNGSRRHFFARATQDADNFVARIMIDNKASIAYSAICSGSRSRALAAIKKLAKYDNEGAGKIPLSNFTKTLSRNYDLEDDYFGRLAVALDPSAESVKSVGYKEFAEHVEELMLGKLEAAGSKSVRDSHASDKSSSKFPKEEIKKDIDSNAQEKDQADKRDSAIGKLNPDQPKLSPSSSSVPDKAFEQLPRAEFTTKQNECITKVSQMRMEVDSHSSYSSTIPLVCSSAPPKQYFKDCATEGDLARSIQNLLRKKGVSEEYLLIQLEKCDTMKEGSVPVDVLYMVFNKLNAGIITVDLEKLIKRWYPEAFQSGKINYITFLSKLL